MVPSIGQALHDHVSLDAAPAPFLGVNRQPRAESAGVIPAPECGPRRSCGRSRTDAAASPPRCRPPAAVPRRCRDRCSPQTCRGPFRTPRDRRASQQRDHRRRRGQLRRRWRGRVGFATGTGGGGVSTRDRLFRPRLDALRQPRGWGLAAPATLQWGAGCAVRHHRRPARTWVTRNTGGSARRPGVRRCPLQAQTSHGTITARRLRAGRRARGPPPSRPCPVAVDSAVRRRPSAGQRTGQTQQHHRRALKRRRAFGTSPSAISARTSATATPAARPS